MSYLGKFNILPQRITRILVLYNMKLKVNEIYGPVKQGEGKSSGLEVLFLRLSGCNLACSWCDTPYTWNWQGTKFVHPEKYDPMKEIVFMDIDEIKAELDKLNTKAVVISGGEPLLQQKPLFPLIEALKLNDYWVEIETNGTIVPDPEFLDLVDQINCSPKLSNSGPDNRPTMRERPEALTALASSSKVSFKWVVTSDKDLEEIETLISKYGMKENHLMPEGKTRVEQLARQDKVKKLCEEKGFKFSPRLHVLENDVKRRI